MALILSIETSTNVCSAAISQNGITLSSSENHIDRSHAALLNQLIEECFINTGLSLINVDAVAISCGPGSYTGLRIGVSSAKGLCYALEKPLISVDTLEIIADMALQRHDFDSLDDVLVCPMIEARRDEVFTAMFNPDLSKLTETNALIVENNSFDHWLLTKKIYCCGNGAEKCKNILDNKNVHYINNIYPSADLMAKHAYQKFLRLQFEDNAYFEPYYLKDFIATKPKNKVLGKNCQNND